MKNSFLLLFLLFSFSVFAQESLQKQIKITQKKSLVRKGYSFQLKEVTSDSRCPQGTQCIWAGEVQTVILVYKDKKKVEETKLTISPNNNDEAIAFFKKYYPKKNSKSVTIFPFPKKKKKTNPSAYYLEITFE